MAGEEAEGSAAKKKDFGKNPKADSIIFWNTFKTFYACCQANLQLRVY